MIPGSTVHIYFIGSRECHSDRFTHNQSAKSERLRIYICLTVPQQVRFPARGDLGGLSLALARGGRVAARRLARLHGAVVDGVRLHPDTGVRCQLLKDTVIHLTIAQFIWINVEQK